MDQDKDTRQQAEPPMQVLFKDPEELSRFIDEALSEELGFSLEDPTQGYVQTKATAIIAGRLRDAVEDQFPFALVTGPAGCSKTITSRRFIQKLREDKPDLNTAYIHAPPDFSPQALVDELATNLFITKVSNFRTLMGIIHQQLMKRPIVAVIDEAQRMPRESLEVLKYLADESGSTFILVCTEDYARLLRRWRDIESRIGVVAEAKPVELEELVSMPQMAGFKPETIKKMHELTGGVMRDVLRLVRQIDRAISKNREKGLSREKFAPRHVLTAAQRINLSGGRT